MSAGFNIALPGTAPVVTTTWTCDANGNWRQEPRIISKDATGWHDIPLADANRRAATEQKERK